MQIELIIKKTSKGYGKETAWCTFDNDAKVFNTIKAAKAWLKDEYGKSKRVKLYVEKKNIKEPIWAGYIISFRNSDVSHYPVQHWIQQDWIEFRQSMTMDLGKKDSTKENELKRVLKWLNSTKHMFGEFDRPKLKQIISYALDIIILKKAEL